MPRNDQQRLYDRLSRRLRKEWKRLRMCRESSRSYHDLGDFYVVDVYRNVIIDTHVDLENLATEVFNAA